MNRPAGVAMVNPERFRVRRLHARAPKGPPMVLPRDPQDSSDWGDIITQQLARLAECRQRVVALTPFTPTVTR